VRIICPDTNLFLECPKASDLPWHELDDAAPGHGPDIRLIVPSTVIKEIDRHKTKGNSRTAKRARDTSALLRRALESPDHRVELRGAKPRVTLELPPVRRVEFSEFPDLDPARPDHQIAAEYATLRKDEPDIALLSNDTLLVLAARSLGFKPILIPETWKLAPEKDGRDDEINKLRGELKTYKQTSPQLSLVVQDPAGNEIAAVHAEIETFELSPGNVDQAITAVRTRFPMESNFGSKAEDSALAQIVNLVSPTGLWRAATADEIRDYQTKHYPEWLALVRNELPDIVTLLNDVSHEITCTILISNTGFVNAAHVRLTITGYGGILLLGPLDEDDEKERTGQLSLPAPPSPPRGRYVSLSSLGAGFGSFLPPTDHFAQFLRPHAKDPNSFYYVGQPDRPVEELELVCEALPHQADPSSISFRVVVVQNGASKQPRLRVRLQASNLRKPLESYLPVAVTVKNGDFLQRLVQLETREE
jgi:hypothetical protein